MKCLQAATVMLLSAMRVSAQTPSPATVLVDRNMTAAAGAHDVLAVQRALAALEDRFLPTRFQETTPVKHALGIGYRLGKFVILELPQDSLAMVVAHEVFGHGARLREIGARNVGYQFRAPPPFGGGSAATSFDNDFLQAATRADRLGVAAAGIEAQNMLASTIGDEAFARGSLSYRESWLYMESRIAGLLYIAGVAPGSPSSNDPARFIRDFNDGCAPPACTPLDASTLKRRALFMLADPMLAFSAYGFGVSYLVNGQTAAIVPAIPLPHGFRYLPAVGFAMTPYGTEWAMTHSVRSGDRQFRFSLRVGDTGTTHAWGVSVRAPGFTRRGRLAAGLSADVWRQPPLDAPPSPAALTTGSLAAATIRVAFGRPSATNRAGAIAEIGYKSDGFVAGERLRAGPIVRVGLTFELPAS